MGIRDNLLARGPTSKLTCPSRDMVPRQSSVIPWKEHVGLRLDIPSHIVLNFYPAADSRQDKNVKQYVDGDTCMREYLVWELSLPILTVPVDVPTLWRITSSCRERPVVDKGPTRRQPRAKIACRFNNNCISITHGVIVWDTDHHVRLHLLN